MMTRAGIFGAAGYGGIELVRMLLQHPEVEITYVGGHTTVGENLVDEYPHLSGALDVVIEESDVAAAVERADLLFFCLPHAVGAGMVAEAIEAGRKVIDFSADYRLKDVETYESYYEPHPAPGLIEQAVYGLPELHREELAGTRYASGTGCNAAVTLLALWPLALRRRASPQRRPDHPMDHPRHLAPQNHPPRPPAFGRPAAYLPRRRCRGLR